jgi:hypothetical protein
MTACSRNERDLPSWSCEFDSRHPLRCICPGQTRIGAPSGNRTLMVGTAPCPKRAQKVMTGPVRLERPKPPRWPDPASWCDADRSTRPACSRVRDDPSAREYWRPRTRRSGSPSAGDHGNEDPPEQHRQPSSSPGPRSSQSSAGSALPRTGQRTSDRQVRPQRIGLGGARSQASRTAATRSS